MKMLTDVLDECRREIARLEAEVSRLKAGKFTKEEIHEICHNLNGTVDAQAFADGCAAEQIKLYGRALDRDTIDRLQQQKRALVEDNRELAAGGIRLASERDAALKERDELAQRCANQAVTIEQRQASWRDMRDERDALKAALEDEEMTRLLVEIGVALMVSNILWVLVSHDWATAAERTYFQWVALALAWLAFRRLGGNRGD